MQLWIIIGRRAMRWYAVRYVLSHCCFVLGATPGCWPDSHVIARLPAVLAWLWPKEGPFNFC
jgi:hypothetical protein